MSKNTSAPPATQGQTLQAVQAPGETESAALARFVLDPSTNAGISAFNFRAISGQSDLPSFIIEMQNQARKVASGDLSGPEAMLVSQAHALDMMFCSLAQRAANNMGSGHVNASEAYLRMALKAQGQCRATIEALGELKHPRTPTFIKQQNNANQQQVNNGGDTRSSTHARAPACEEKSITPTNELLSEGQHAGMVTRGAGATVGAGKELEAVGAVNRPH